MSKADDIIWLQHYFWRGSNQDQYKSAKRITTLESFSLWTQGQNVTANFQGVLDAFPIEPDKNHLIILFRCLQRYLFNGCNEVCFHGVFANRFAVIFVSYLRPSVENCIVFNWLCSHIRNFSQLQLLYFLFCHIFQKNRICLWFRESWGSLSEWNFLLSFRQLKIEIFLLVGYSW